MSIRNQGPVLLLTLALALGAPTSQAQAPAAETALRAISTSDTEAAKFASSCIPQLAEAKVQQAIKEAAEKRKTTFQHRDAPGIALIVNPSRTLCINLGQSKYPTLPIDEFSQTIEFSGLSDTERTRLYTGISQALAANGFASALIRDDKGNAYAIAYLFAQQGVPQMLYYTATHFKPGSYIESSFPLVVSAGPDMTMSITSRNPNQEHSKHLFAK